MLGATFRQKLKSCPHGEHINVYIMDNEIYHYQGVKRVKCQDYDKRAKAQSSFEKKNSLTNDAGCVKMRVRSGRELAVISLCEFANGTCDCKERYLDVYCDKTETAYERILELTLKD